MVKGVHVLGTGDITHPAWRDELREQLVRDDSTGLYRCTRKTPVVDEIPLMDTVQGPEPLFMLQGEISSIYKRHGKVRRVHNLVYFPDFDTADRACALLAGVANLTSDGRPIMGIDCCDLLEMLKDCAPQAHMIPAHVWTPWFALFGSKSGFDSVPDCFGHMSGEIFALETGLSSDPAMNRLWSHLDGYTLISNSDAHSGENLAREVNIFHGKPSYTGIFAALRPKPAIVDKLSTSPRHDTDSTPKHLSTDKPSPDCFYGGTVEFFPEEGKYHLDGHRDCNVVLEPHESMALNNICPVCAKPLTIGVLHRILTLADRLHPPAPLGIDGDGFSSLVPLPELLGELLQTGPKSQKVQRYYAKLIGKLGSELNILHHVAESDLRQHWDALGEGIARMRRGEVVRQGGYDGEYGTVRVFSPQEAAALQNGRKRETLLDMPSPLITMAGKKRAPLPVQSAEKDAAQSAAQDTEKGAPTALYSPEQLAIIQGDDSPVLVAAGPGSGKTRTLVGRIGHLLSRGISPRRILALTFTRRAATELEERLRAVYTGENLPLSDTLHALAFSMWHNTRHSVPDLLSEDMSHRAFVLAHKGVDVSPSQLQCWEKELAYARERGHIPPHLEPCAERYAVYKNLHHWVDYTDLLECCLEQLHNGHGPLPWTHVLVDEVQDLSPLQLAVVQALLPPDGTGFFGIGDPDQAIYGFRGAQANSISVLREQWPTLRCVPLSTNYRSAPAIVHCATDLLRKHQHCGVLTAQGNGPASLHLFSAPHVDSEAQWVAGQIRHLLGDTSHTITDKGAKANSKQNRKTANKASPPLLTIGAQAEQKLPRCHMPRGSYAPADIAVLVRLKSQIPPLHKALERWGIPCAVPEQEGCWHHPLVAIVLQHAAAQEHMPAAPSASESASAAPQKPQKNGSLPPCPSHVWRGGPTALAAYWQDMPPFDALFWQGSAWKALEKLWSTAAGWKGVLTHIHLLRDVEMVRHKAERVQIMTLHASKGLEFKAVCIVGLEEGVLPLQRERLYGPPKERTEIPAMLSSSDAAGGIDSAASRHPAEARDEERRLLYVGLTRASEVLLCSHVQQRSLYGRTLELGPSSFLRDIIHHYRQSTLVKKVRKEKRQLSLLD